MPLFRRLLLYATLLAAIFLLLSAWLPLLNPQHCWPSGFAGLLFPICWIANLLFVPLWIIYRKHYYWFPLAGILLSVPALYHSVAVHPMPVAVARNNHAFTLMTFNTSSMGLKRYKVDSVLRSSIYRTLAQASPDILCLQEFYTNTPKADADNITRLQQELHYPYYYFTCDQTRWNTWQYGIAIFSRYPLLNACKIPCGRSAFGSGSSILQADVLVHNDTIRVFSTQLKSYMFRSNDYAFLELNDTQLNEGKSLFGKMRHTIYQRAAQARQLAGLITESPYSTLVCGDFNDTPVSYTYNTVSQNMRDAFLEKGWGLGRTLSYLSPTLRIDYILAQPAFTVAGYTTFKVKGFEHFPVMASLSLQ